MSNIVVLGMGLMGPTIAKGLTEEHDVNYIRGCDTNNARLKAATDFVANRKFEAVELDISRHDTLVDALKDCDVVVNAVAEECSIPILKAAMQAKVSVVDLTDGAYPLEGDLYGEVKKADITAIPGCGVDPGLIDILSGHGMDLMHKVEEVHLASGGLPKVLTPPLNFKIVMGGTKIRMQPGKVSIVSDGKQAMADRYGDMELFSVKGYPDMEAFCDGYPYPSSLLRLCLEKGVKTFQQKTIRYKGFVEKLKFLLDLGIFSSNPINHHGKEIVPLDFFNELVRPLVRFDEEAGDRDAMFISIKVVGRSDDADVEVNYNMADAYDEKKKITSMAKTTGYTAAIVARMLARGDIPQKGIQWPVHVIKEKLFEELFNTLRRKGVEITETATRTREL